MAAVGGYLHLATNDHPVVDGVVYRSAQPTPAMIERFAARDGIRTIVNLRGPWEKESWYQAERATAQRLGIELYDIPFFTHQLAPMSALRRFLTVLDEAPRPILIHCRRGADRTALASALCRVFLAGDSLEDALGQYHLWFGHIGWAHGDHLPHLFDCYRDWLRRQGSSHSPAELRRFIETEPTVGYFAAEIVPAAPVRGRVADPLTLSFHVKNISPYPWDLCPDPKKGIHLELQLEEPNGERELVGGGPAGRVLPGETVVMTAALPPFTQPGNFPLIVDLVDRGGLVFCIMGVGRCYASLEIADGETKGTEAVTWRPPQ